MTIKEPFVSALLRIYPPHWRSEYGAELSDLLLTQPLSAIVVADVAWNGARQRARSLELSTVLGMAAMLVIVGGFVQNIVAPLPYIDGLATSLLQPSMITLPTLVVAPLNSNLYILALVACGCGTYLRNRGVSSPGVAAMKVTLIAGIPVMVAAFLMLTGVLATTVIGPADTPTAFQQHGLTFTFYSTDDSAPSPWSVLVSPLFRLPWSFLWGTIGGRVGIHLARRMRLA
jgi:hypothetical protein